MTLAGPLAVLGEAPPASISGGADISQHQYTFRITHQHAQPLVYVEIPHFRADLFTVPDGWLKQLTNQNSFDDQLGKCTAEPGPGNPGLRRGESLEVSLRVCPTGAPVGKGEILLRFLDGAQYLIAAELPVRETTLHRQLPLIGGGSIFVILLAARAFRRRRRARVREGVA